ncbi:type III-A CRISPR-associated protein Cas10/Csm1 [Chloroflexus sp.]|uniref:type III-A CRISPR-associated protein Cas10/Csm1 n=1 Tax=Chloroflexus sp. TaxID=1904827 RepID=UPI002639B268|nr:type III-A CRISPR-associated protein Cas10/Csm1 [uncultured Chloroflexus sp.]
MTHSKPLDVAWQTLVAWTQAALGQSPSASPALIASAWQIVGQEAQTTWPASTDGLATIFTRLTSPSLQLWQPPAALSCRDDALFPVNQPRSPTESFESLQQALNIGLNEASQTADPALRLERLLVALQRYAWSWPSPLPAVSLYDLARLHAATQAAQAADPDGAICLIGGDLSGLQDFLYSIPAEGAARQLRGRSFYLQLLTDACARYVLRQCDMPLCNLLYAGGGRFYVVAPGSAAGQAMAWRREIGQTLLAGHAGALYLAVGATQPFRPDAYSDNTWRELSEAIDHDKRRRFAALDETAFARIFQPRPPRPPRADGQEQPDPLGESLADLGRQLTRAAILQIDPVAQPMAGSTWRSVISRLGVLYELLPDNTRPRAQALALDDEAVPHEPRQAIRFGQRYTVTEAYRLSATDLQRLSEDDPAQAIDLEVGDVAPLNTLARRSEGIPRIAVLRMDVDNLGDLFGRGLQRPSGLAGLAVTAALSSALSRFFEGWVGEICRQFNQRANGGVYAVYSGGDDLFLVGSWHLIPELAVAIRNDFVRYVTGAKPTNTPPPISVSAGITLHRAGYPLYQAAEDAGNALDAAKAYVHTDGHSKDAITFLGRTLGWNEFMRAMAWKDELRDLIGQGAPRTLLMTLQALATRASARYNRSGTPQVTVGLWVWQGAYQLTRLAERSGQLRPRIETLRDQLVSAEGIAGRAIVIAGLAARWTQLLLRGADQRR